MVINSVLELSDLTNKYLQNSSPWNSIKKRGSENQKILSLAINLGKSCITLLKPILPKIAKMTKKILQINYNFSFQNASINTGFSFHIIESIFNF